MDVSNPTKIEWENEIPYSVVVLNRTLHAMLGEGEEPSNKDFVLGLLNFNKENRKWGITSVIPKHNDTFGSHSFGQVNSSISITVKAIDEKKTSLKIVTSARQGDFIGACNQSYLQDECEKFITALSYYLEHSELVIDWEENYKPQVLANNSQDRKKGCAMFLYIPLVVGASGLNVHYLC